MDIKCYTTNKVYKCIASVQEKHKSYTGWMKMNEEGTVMIILTVSETNANNLRQLYILKKKKTKFYP